MMMRRLEFHLSYECAQRCAFCSESGRMARFADRPVSAREIAEVLATKRRACDHVTWTGGEPSAHPAFLGALRAARKLGYRNYVTSNGGHLSDPGFALKALPLIDELCLSVHGDRADVHDRLTGAPGSYERVQAALDQAQAVPRIFLLTNTVISAVNVSRAEAILRSILARPGVKHCLFSNVAPEGRGQAAYRGLAVPLSRWRKLIARLAPLADARGVALRFFGLPLCAFGPHRDNSNDLHFSPRVTVERCEAAAGPELVDIVSEKPTRRRVQPKACGGCTRRDSCGGVFDSYVDAFGDGELEPIS